MRQGRSAWILAILSIVLSVADAVGTEILVRQFGGEEANPVWAWFMSEIGSWWIMPKLLLNVFASLFLLACWRIRLARIGLTAYVTVYAIIVGIHVWLMIHAG